MFTISGLTYSTTTSGSNGLDGGHLSANVPLRRPTRHSPLKAAREAIKFGVDSSAGSFLAQELPNPSTDPA